MVWSCILLPTNRKVVHLITSRDWPITAVIQFLFILGGRIRELGQCFSYIIGYWRSRPTAISAKVTASTHFDDFGPMWSNLELGPSSFPFPCEAVLLGLDHQSRPISTKTDVTKVG